MCVCVFKRYHGEIYIYKAACSEELNKLVRNHRWDLRAQLRIDLRVREGDPSHMLGMITLALGRLIVDTHPQTVLVEVYLANNIILSTVVRMHPPPACHRRSPPVAHLHSMFFELRLVLFHNLIDFM